MKQIFKRNKTQGNLNNEQTQTKGVQHHALQHRNSALIQPNGGNGAAKRYSQMLHHQILSDSEVIKSRSYADIRLKLGMKKNDFSKGAANQNDRSKQLPINSEVFLPKDISDNHWGEINKHEFEKHVEK